MVALIDRAHALRDCLVLQRDAVDTAVATPAALRFAVDQVVVARVSHGPEPSERIRRAWDELRVFTLLIGRPGRKVASRPYLPVRVGTATRLGVVHAEVDRVVI